MKIALISSGIDSLSLFKFLSKYDHEYLIYLDTLQSPYWEKSLEVWIQAAKTWIERALSQGAETIILPPILEMYFLQSSDQDWFIKKSIFPLFSSYLMQEVFPHSLVGKIGIFGEGESLTKAQTLINRLSETYQPTSDQLAIKKFAFPFHFWTKDTRIFAQLLQKLWWKSLLVNTLIKHDLRYFKDAAVDSLIPINYSYFHAEQTISKFLNFKKIKFHKLAKLEKIFTPMTLASDSSYQIKVHATDTKHPLLSEKRLLRILQRGASISLERC